MKQRVLVFLLMISTPLAGCVNEPTEGNTAELPAEGQPLSDSVLDDFAFEMEDCIATNLLSEISTEWARPFLPDGFNVRSATSAEVTAFLRIEDCGRVVSADGVEENVAILTGGFSALRDTRSGDQEPVTLVVQSITNSIALRDRLAEVGVNVLHAEIERRQAPVADEVEFLGWQVRSSDVHLNVEFLNGNVPQATTLSTDSYWHVGAPVVQVYYNDTEYSVSPIEWDAAVVALGGEYDLRSLFGDQSSIPAAQSNTLEASYSRNYVKRNTTDEQL